MIIIWGLAASLPLAIQSFYFLLCVFLEKTAISKVQIAFYNCLFHKFMD